MLFSHFIILLSLLYISFRCVVKRHETFCDMMRDTNKIIIRPIVIIMFAQSLLSEFCAVIKEKRRITYLFVIYILNLKLLL